MAKRSSKQKDNSRSINDKVVQDAELPVKPAANKAKPPRPVKKQDIKDIDRADSEGMGQPQGVAPKTKKPAAATPSTANQKATAKKSAKR